LLVPVTARYKRRSAAAGLLISIVGSNATEGMDVCCECCVLSGRDLCDELITCPQQSYLLWCVDVCDIENSWMMRPWPTGGCNEKKKILILKPIVQNDTEATWNCKGRVNCSLLTQCLHVLTVWNVQNIFFVHWHIVWVFPGRLYTRFNKNPSARNFLSPKPEVTCGTVAIIIRVVLLSPYLRIRAVSLSFIHYNQSHRVYINRRRQYICLILN